jgi:hypothetical protein
MSSVDACRPMFGVMSVASTACGRVALIPRTGSASDRSRIGRTGSRRNVRAGAHCRAHRARRCSRRDAVLVESDAQPAFRLRREPRVHDGDARRGDRHASATDGIAATPTAVKPNSAAASSSRRRQFRRVSAEVRMMNDPALKRRPAASKAAASRMHPQVGVPEAERGEVVVGVVVDDECARTGGVLDSRRSPAPDPAPAASGIENGNVLDALRLTLNRGPCVQPTSSYGRRILGIVVLPVEQDVGGARVRLVHAHHVAARGEGLVADRRGAGPVRCTSMPCRWSRSAAAPADPAADHRGEHVRRGSFVRRLRHRTLTLQVEALRYSSRLLATSFSAMSSALCWRLTLLRIDHTTCGSGVFGRCHCRCDVRVQQP